MILIPTSMRSAFCLIALLAVTGCDAFGGSDDATDFDSSERLFPARQNGDRVLIDRTGRVVVDLDGYNSARSGAEGLTPARRRENNRNVWDFFDSAGQIAFSVQADEAYAPRNGRARVRLDGRWAFVDTDGAFIVNPYLRDARDFSGNLARVKTTGNSWGFLDRGGQVAIDPAFSSVGDFQNGRARFERSGKVGFIDETGEVVIPAVYDDARDFSDGRAAVRQGQRWSYIDLEDNRLLDSQTFISAGDYGSGLAPVRIENRWEYVNENGERQIAPQFDSARAFVGDRAAVEVDGRWTFVRPDGTQLRAPEFDQVDDFAGGLAEVTVDDKRGYIDLEGATVWLPRD
ncbi:WG repeat-containing protein [Rubrivirga sp.]|uniref:WG repeat-containing protein n=1 Tax=Rubrivirga sp. TaxID=1885344 RepID=UPI003C723473